MKLQATKKGSSIILLTFLVASTLLIFPQSTFAQTKPSAPQFTVTYADYSYDIPATYGVDEFTGKTEIKTYERHVDNKTFTFKIKNQPFTPYEDSQGNTIQLCYNLRFKGHYGGEWKYFPYLDNGQGSSRCSAGIYSMYNPILPASSDQYTSILEGLSLFGENQPAVGDKVDFQVQALFGYVSYAGDGFYSFSGQASDWSSTQTITIGKTAPAATQFSTVAPTQPSTTAPNATANATLSGTQQGLVFEFDLQIVVIAVLAVAVVILALVVVLQWQGNRKTGVQ
jgi:hypothetical protein